MFASKPTHFILSEIAKKTLIKQMKLHAESYINFLRQDFAIFLKKNDLLSYRYYIFLYGYIPLEIILNERKENMLNIPNHPKLLLILQKFEIVEILISFLKRRQLGDEEKIAAMVTIFKNFPLLFCSKAQAWLQTHGVSLVSLDFLAFFNPSGVYERNFYELLKHAAEQYPSLESQETILALENKADEVSPMIFGTLAFIR